MKKFVFALLTLCFTIGISAQSIKSIRINGQEQQQKYISISEIDSITHDVSNQLQTFWSDGYATSFSLSDIESVSFEDREVKYSYVENYIDSLDAIFSDEGYAAVFGGFEIPTSVDVTSLERAIYVTKVDLHAGTIDETDATLVVVDSTDVPTQIISKKGIMRLSQLENGHLCCLYKLDGQEEWTEIDEIDFDLSQAAPKSTRRRSLATGGVSNFTIASVLKALSIVNSLKGCFQSAYNNNLNDLYSNGLGFFGNYMENDEVSVGAGLVSAGLTKSLGSGLLSILQYAGEKIADGPIKYLGPVRLAIEDVGQTSRKACSITYSVTGLHEYGMANSWLYFELYKGQRRIDTIYLPSENGTVTKTIENLEPGQYGVVLHIKTKKYHWEYTTYPEVKFTIFDLGLDRYEIEDNPSYSNGTVNFKMNVYLKGSDEGLGDIQQFGYYTRYSNSIPDYKQVSHLSTIFESTPLTYELPIEREGFFEENRNYNTFEAKATGYYIGAYVVLKNGNIVTIDEQEIEGLIYKQKPSLTFTSASMGGVSSQTYQDDEGNEYIFYSVPYWFDFNVEGAFWIDYVQYTIYGDGWTYNGGNPIIVYDGPYSYESSMGYDEGSNLNTVDFYTITLTNGSTMRSSNSMIFGGADANPTISVGGAPNFARQRQSPSVKSQNSTGKRVNTKTGIGIVNKNRIQ